MIRINNTSTSKEIQKILQKKIKNNTKFVDEINQYLHNKGVELIKRYDVITAILLDNENNHPGCPLSRWRLSGYEKS